MAALPTPVAPGAPAGEFVRLTSCTHCGGRSRSLAEAGPGVVGRCLDCGRAMATPLAVEVHGDAGRPGTRAGRAPGRPGQGGTSSGGPGYTGQSPRGRGQGRP